MASSDVISSYIVCATPRSGSNVLCEMLASLGFAGRPFEHLWVPEGTELEPLGEQWPRVVRAATGENGVFGIKLMWYQADRLERELPAVLDMVGESLGSVLRVSLADPRYIFLTRRDHVRQAISLERATQTRQWRSMDVPTGELHYDAEALRGGVEFIEQDEADWKAFFARQGISPYRLIYEVLDADPASAVNALLADLGYDGPPVNLSSTEHRRQADEVTEAWVRRFRDGS